jgi:hypothetical protein
VQPVQDAKCTVLKRVPSSDADIEALEISSEPGVTLPAWLFLPKRADPEKPLLILLEPAGKLGRWHEGELYQTLAGQGFAVCVPDLRGVGDLRPAFGRGAAQTARTHNSEEEYAWSSLILGRPLLGQRVTDMLSVLHAIRRHPAVAGKRVVVAAQGKMTVPALFAALLDSDWSGLYLSGGLVSFRSLVETEQYDYPFANFVPGIAGYMDLPEIVRAVAPKKVVLAGTVNAAGRMLGPTVERKMYEGADHVVVLDRAAWDATAFAGL